MTNDNRHNDYRPQRRSFLGSRPYSKPKIHSSNQAEGLNWSNGINHDDPAHYLDIKPSRQKTKAKPAQKRQSRSNVLKRQGLKKLPPFKPRKIKRNPIKIASASLVLLAVSFGLFAIFKPESPSVDQPETNVKSAQDLNEKNLSISEPTIEQVKNHKVSPDEIRYFQAKKISLNSRVFQVTMKEDKLATPDNIHDIGWYKGSSKPGSGSATLLTGTIASNNNLGALRIIGSLKPNDVIDVVMGDGTSHSYRVVTTKTYPSDRVSIEELSLPIESGKEGLNIIGMSDRFDVSSQKFEPSYAVFAVKI